MPAYLIADLDVTDSEAFEAYQRDVPALIARHGGEYLVRGGEHEVLEGDWRPSRLVVLRFPDRGAIRALFADPDYQPVMAVRQQAASSRIVAVCGC